MMPKYCLSIRIHPFSWYLNWDHWNYRIEADLGPIGFTLRY